MRVWDLHPRHLCRIHLLAEHRELHGLWNILTTHKGRGGYSRHPETLRWVGKQKALYLRHEALVKEFARRGYRHRTPLDKRLATGSGRQRVFIDTVKGQKTILKKKPCECLLHVPHRPQQPRRTYFLYIVECADGSLYTGITTDVARRLAEHKAGTAARYTRAKGAARVIYAEECADRSAALKREAQVKRWPRQKKLALIHSSPSA